MYVHEQILSERGLQERELPVSLKSEISRFRIKQKDGTKEDELFRHSQKIATLIDEHANKLDAEKRAKEEAELAKKKEQEEKERIENEAKLAQEAQSKAQQEAELKNKKDEEENQKKQKAMEQMGELRCKVEVQKLGADIPKDVSNKIKAVHMTGARYKKEPKESILNALKNADNTACNAIQDELSKREEATRQEQEKSAQAAAAAIVETTPPPVKKTTGNSILDMLYGLK